MDRNTSIGILLGVGIVVVLAFGLSIIPNAESNNGDIFLIQSNGNGTGCTDLDCLDDVFIFSVSSNQILVYNSTSGQWENEFQIDFLINNDELIGGDVLRFNASSGFWENYNNEFVTDASNLGTVGEGVYLGTKTSILDADGNQNWRLDFKKILAGTGITVSSNGTRITITNSAPDNTVCANLGTASSLSEGVYASGECDFKLLLESSGITLSSNSTHITLTNALPESTACNNIGSGLGLCAGGNVNVFSLIEGTGIDIADTGSDYTFASNCNNTGTGEPVCESSNNINSLIAGTGISITDTTGDLTITSTIVGERNIGQQAGDVYASLTKTNIGNAYVDIYVSAFDEENMLIVDCANVTYGRVSYIWDYVGTGTQQLRWVDVSNNANVFYESPTFTTDRDAVDSGYFVKPSWCTTIVSLEQQGKSTVAGDDPVAKGYVITVK